MGDTDRTCELVTGWVGRWTEHPPPTHSLSLLVTDTRKVKSLGVTMGRCPDVI